MNAIYIKEIVARSSVCKKQDNNIIYLSPKNGNDYS